MNESPSRVWTKIVVYYGLTLIFSTPFYAVLVSNPMRAGDLLYVTGLMWCPGFAAMATKLLFRESVRDLGWGWGKSIYQLWAYLLPLAYAVPAYLVTWTAGLGEFYNRDFVAAKTIEFGWSGHSPTQVLLGYIALTGTIGMVPSLSRALGEEIGWRGFLVPELAKVVSFPGLCLISGILWAAWHYPLLLFGQYNAGTAPWFALACFTCQVVAISFLAAWLRLRSGSLWTGAILHAAHNLFIQAILTRLTRFNDKTAYVVDEFGVGMVVTTLIAAILVVWKLPRPKQASSTAPLAEL